MNMSVAESERYRYMWTRGYERNAEYEKNPSWTDPIRVEEDEIGGTFTAPSIRFYDRYAPEDEWIASDNVENLNDMI